MKKQEQLTKLYETVGGQWKMLSSGAVARFPAYHASAVVGVLNVAAEQADGWHAVTSMHIGKAVTMDPNAPRNVVVPASLLDNKHFMKALDAGLKTQIAQQMSRQLSHSVGAGLY